MVLDPLEAKRAAKRAAAARKTFGQVADALDERALMLAGLPNADIDEGIAVFCRELSEGFLNESMPAKFRRGFIIAAADIVRGRISEMELSGSGKA